jgi:hypothetical protein
MSFFLKKFLCEKLYNSKFLDEKDVFVDIEFYLPQLAHLIVHFGSDVCSGLGRFAMILSQTSLHSAFQLSFMFRAYMEDFQKETNGKKNPSHDVILFHRCVRLLQVTLFIILFFDTL